MLPSLRHLAHLRQKQPQRRQVALAAPQAARLVARQRAVRVFHRHEDGAGQRRLLQRRRHQRHRQPLRHQRHHAQPMLQLVQRLRREARRLAGADDARVVVGRHTARHQRQRLAGQRGERQRAPPRQRMRRWHAGDEGLAGHQQLRQPFGRMRDVGEAGVQPRVLQFDQLLAGAEFAQAQLQARVFGLKAPQHLGQAAVQHGAGKADRQAPDLPTGRVARGRQRLRGLVDGGLRGRHQRLPRRRQLHAPAVAQEQRSAHLGLQLLDRHRQRRLAQAQALGRAAEVPLVGHGQKVAQMAQFHE